MKIVADAILGLIAVLSVLALLFQGFLFPAMSAGLCLTLRIAAAVCVQWVFLHISEKKFIRAIPLMAASCLAVWGFFLYLTSPSWLGATFGLFLADYASPAFGCAFVLMVNALVPRLIRALVRRIRKRNRKKKAKPSA